MTSEAVTLFYFTAFWQEYM